MYPTGTPTKGNAALSSKDRRHQRPVPPEWPSLAYEDWKGTGGLMFAFLKDTDCSQKLLLFHLGVLLFVGGTQAIRRVDKSWCVGDHFRYNVGPQSGYVG